MFALIALIVLLIVGRVMDELGWSTIGVIVLSVFGAALVMSALGVHPIAMTAVYAVIDVCLVLKIFKGDLKLS